MALLTTRAVAATVSTLITKVRRLIGDTDTTTTNQRWSDSDILAMVDDMLAEMYVLVTENDPSGFLQTSDMTYTADALAVALPSGIAANNIYKVEKVDDQTAPVFLRHRNYLDINEYTDERGWCLGAMAIDSAGTATAAPGGAIALRPIPTAATALRIYTLAPYIPVSGSAAQSTDQHALSINHEELITLGAAIRLQEVDNEVPPTRLPRFQTLWDQYEKTVNRYSGRQYVANTRVLS